MSLKLVRGGIRDWKIGELFVGCGGGSHVWRVIEVADEASGLKLQHQPIVAKCLRDGETRSFYADQIVPIEQCDVRETFL